MKNTAAFLVIAILSVSQAFADEYPKAYEANYEETSPAGKVTKTHSGSDGKGHVRQEVGAGLMGGASIVLEDYPNNKSISLMPESKLYIIRTMKNIKKIPNLVSAEQAKATPLGTKTIEGHPCHGFLRKSPLGTSEYWIGDDIDHVVLSEVTTQRGKCITRLKSFSANAPAEDLMAIPAGYKQMEMPHFHL